MRSFLLIWMGHVVSDIGSHLSSFALGVWVFRTTQSATLFALMLFLGALPRLVVLPFAGALADRWGRRKTIILCDVVVILTWSVLALQIARGRMELWHLYATVAVSSTATACRGPAFGAIITQLVPREHLARASGLFMMGVAAAEILGPTLGVALMQVVELRGVVWTDIATFCLALLPILFLTLPDVAPVQRGADSSLMRDIREGWAYLAGNRGLFGLAVYIGLLNLYMGFVLALTPPMVLGFTTPAELGRILSIAGFGTLAGSLVMSITGGPKRRMSGVIGAGIVAGISMSLTGVRPSPILVTLGLLGVYVTGPIASICMHVIFQTKTPTEMLGRVFALRGVILSASVPIAFLASGPLAERVFEPLLMPGGLFAESLGPLLGTGPGRGTGLLMVVLGIAMLVSTFAIYLFREVHRVEELPDALAPAPEKPHSATLEPAAVQ
jgi:MFS family permease